MFSLSNFLKDQSDWAYTRRVHADPNLPLDLSSGPAHMPGGITCIETYAGRVWFSGAASFIQEPDERSPNLESYIFFSQVVDNFDNIGRCYQENDPTSEEAPDLVDSDGGAVRIPDMQRAIKLVSLGRQLLVFAQNGIWEISGGEANFSATSFEIRKVTNTRVISVDSIVEAEGSVLFWAEEGIFLLSPDEVSLRVQAQNVTEDSIQTWFLGLSAEDKQSARGVFDPSDRKVRWLYGQKKNPAVKLTSKPYPYYFYDRLDVGPSVDSFRFIQAPIERLDLLPSIDSWSLEVIVGYVDYEMSAEAMDMVPTIESFEITIVVDYVEYEFEPEAMDMVPSIESFEITIVVDYIEHIMQPESMDLIPSIESFELLPV